MIVVSGSVIGWLVGACVSVWKVLGCAQCLPHCLAARLGPVRYGQ